MLVILLDYKSLDRVINFHCAVSHDIPTYHIMTLGNWNGLGCQYGQVVGVILSFKIKRFG